ncbi:hypothetical protein MAPG_02499 [Magnaporthiopsis poae ATCC 64411]|uniref:Uncharacterized protein n=1 Tax=Magnaporthiopsis poae (strain ATCC 64411 / 73-15) TaxID=644358 RepID=A0A0C4DRJ0_MAGP6|nr:hypothetical protein MAPG_02499 [Magnaporthiopsis poae ATCC 64411]
MADQSQIPAGAHEVQEDKCYVALTNDRLDVQAVMDRVRSPEAGAIVVFVGTTRDNFDGKAVKELQYSAYNPVALRSMMSIAKDAVEKHGLKGIAMVHRLGVVPVGEDSIVVTVSAPHRQAAWRAGEEGVDDACAYAFAVGLGACRGLAQSHIPKP